MRLLPFLLAALILAAPAVGANSSGDIAIRSLEPTVLFPKKEPLAQIARLMMDNRINSIISVEVTVTVAGGPPGAGQPLTLVPNQSTYDVLIPDIAAPAEVRIEVRAAGTVLATHVQTWQPQRKWRIFIVKSSHEDIGYENFIFKKQHDIANFVDLGRELSSPKSVAGNIGATVQKRMAFHYTMETILFQRNYIEERGERAWREVVEHDIKPGHISLMGAPSGVHSHWMDYEELARMAYPARRETKDRFGLDLKTFMIVDNPSLSWSGAQTLANAGFKYVARWGQSWRTGNKNDYETTKVPALFWWVGPDGVSKVLYSWRSHYAMGLWWGQTGTYREEIELASGQVSKFLRLVEGGLLGPYPYDAVVTPEYVDHDTPRFDTRVLPIWAERYAFPQIQVASPEDFFTYVEGKYAGQIPTLSGDLNNYSADYSSIDPESQGWKREAARLLPSTEGLAAIVGSWEPAALLSPSVVERAYTRMFDYDEHCWPTLPQVSDAQLFNANWVKKHEARRVLDIARILNEQMHVAFARQLTTGDGEQIAVFNSLAHPRSELARLKGAARAVVDVSTGQRVICDLLEDGNSSFVASDVPALGYRIFQVERGVSASASSLLAADATTLTSPHYKITFDPSTGAISSILDRELNRELIDATAPQQANQLVYVVAKERESKELTHHLVKGPKRHETKVGPGQASYTVWIDDPSTGAAIQQTVTVYSTLKRIDIVNHLDHASALYVGYQDRYRNNIFYAFPFKVEGGQFRVEYPGGVVRPFKDQLRWGSHDYLHANRWVDVSNAEFGVTVAPWNTANFHFGEIRYNQFSNDYEPKNSWLYSYAWSDRMSGLITLNADDCNATFGYSITSHRGNWNSGATTHFGWSVASPLEVIPLATHQKGGWTAPSQSFLSLDQPNIQLTVLKAGAQPAGGWIVRLVETEGRATETTLDVRALGVDAARETSLVEDDLGPVVVNQGKLTVKLRPFGFLTLRLLRGVATASVAQVTATVASDSEVNLSWTAIAGATYNIYRSDDPAAPATDYTLIARAIGGGFNDHGLNARTSYFYRVAALSDGNRQGPFSPVAVVQTSALNRTAPRPVEELGVVRHSSSSLFVYWRRNAEPDVAKYYVYRSQRPGFDPKDLEPVAALSLDPDNFLQVYADKQVKPGQTYFYQILSEDWAGNRQTHSPEIAVTAPKS